MTLKEYIARDDAFELLKKYNKDPFHIQHALTVEAVMKWYANELGYGEDAEYWGIVGLLHDIDFELYPAEHCLKAPELVKRWWCVRGYYSCGLFSWLWNYSGMWYNHRCRAGS